MESIVATLIRRNRAWAWSKIRALLVALLVCGSANASLGGDFDPQAIYATSSVAVVFVLGAGGGTQMAGTGSIIHRDGLVLTNAHVVVNAASGLPYERLWVFLKPDRLTGKADKDLIRRVKVQVVASNRDLDLAVLKLEEIPEPLRVIPLGDSNRVQIGERVAAIGHPEQGGLWSLTTGVISAAFVDYNHIPGKHMFQTETSLNRGNSGGPLINAEGQLIGINTAIARVASDGLPITSINFSVQAAVARDWLAGHGIQIPVALSASHYPSKASIPEDRRPGPPHSLANAQPPTQPPSVMGPSVTSVPPVPRREPLPPPRPFDLDQLVKGLDRVEESLEQQMKGMEAEIGKRRQ